MKTSSARGNSKPPTARELAQACFTSNLAVPGLGTFISGKKVLGCVQLAIYFTAFGLTVFFGLGFLFWMIPHWSEIYQIDPDDPLARFRLMWPHVRWAFFGVLLFAISWVWALQTSLSLLRKAKKVPPAL